MYFKMLNKSSNDEKKSSEKLKVGMLFQNEFQCMVPAFKSEEGEKNTGCDNYVQNRGGF